MSIENPSATLVGSVPTAVQCEATVVEQEQMAHDTYRLRLHCPKLATQICPGQFFMIRSPGDTDPLLGRPFALYDIFVEDNEPVGVDFGYLVVGKLTRLMSQWKPGDTVEIWGPLGNGFPLPQAGHLMMVAGGIGQTPFLATAREALAQQSYGSPARRIIERPTKVSLCYGARSANYLAGLNHFEQQDKLNFQIATDDGSQGHHGFVTELLRNALDGNEPPTHVYSCGPEPMMQAVAKLCAERNVPCWLSLETPMACGFGACFSCVTRVKQDDGSWDYRRTCVEGPIFPAETLMFD